MTPSRCSTSASAVFPEGWTGLVGENGAGKSTLLRARRRRAPAAGGTDPPRARRSRGRALRPGRRGTGRGCGPPGRQGRRSCLAAPGSARPGPTDLERWSSLSPGERRRWQIAGALAREPRVLLLDEPTNHLDADGRALVLATLQRFRGRGWSSRTTAPCSRPSPPDGQAPPREADAHLGRLRGGEGDLGRRPRRGRAWSASRPNRASAGPGKRCSWRGRHAKRRSGR